MEITLVKEYLRKLSESLGGVLYGTCRLDELRDDFHHEIKRISAKLNTGISVGILLSPAVLDTLVDRPNMLYKAHYQQVNCCLDTIALRISMELNHLGHDAIPVPASQILDWKRMRAHLSHREIAFKAGLGWWGRNNLLVNNKYGSQVRLVTVLTDAELPPDSPVEFGCGDCFACGGVCPAGAISEEREEFDLKACHEKVSEFGRPENIGTLICGLCQQACCGNR